MGSEAKLMDYMWVVCTKCGAGHSFEDFARSDPGSHRVLKIRELPQGAEENNIDTVWIPTCVNCGNETFYVQLDPEDVIEFLKETSEQLVKLDGTPDRKESLEIWRARAEQAEEEFQRWREARKRIK